MKLETKTMSESESNPLPGWIVREQREKAELDRKAKEDREKQLEAARLVQSEGREFWAQLLGRLELNVKALPALVGAELVGSASPSGGPTTPELSCHIQVNRQSVKHGPALSKMNLWYHPGGYRIRRWYQDCEMEDITLQPGRKGVEAVIDDYPPMTAVELGDHIVRNMALQVRADNDRGV
jgi:hypothetical protein